MNLEEANNRLKTKITEDQLQGLSPLYILLDLHKDDFCKIVNVVGLDTLLKKQKYYECLEQAGEELAAKERYLQAKVRLEYLELEKSSLEKVVNGYLKELMKNAKNSRILGIWTLKCNLVTNFESEVKTMNNSSYKIYITRSADTAYLISRGLREDIPWSKQGGETLGIGSGCVHKDCRIPPMYHGSDRFYALIEYRNGEDFDYPEYQVIIY